MTTAYIQHPTCALHDMGAEHPECPDRLAAINDALINARLMELLRVVDAVPATREQIARVHSPEHIEHVCNSVPVEGFYPLDADTNMNSHSLAAAELAAGAVVQATNLVMCGDAKQVFCAVRPPGHHAEYSRAMGFCIFNNIAVGVAHALAEHGIQRAAVLDFDVHHGNGTEDIFKDDPRVMLCSSFQHPFFPYLYGESQTGHLINVPLSAGSDSAAFRAAVLERWLPELDAFKPEIIYISAGFDAHRLDPLAQVNLVEDDFAWVTREIKKVANQYSEGRIISALEGGYDLQALGRSVVAHLGVLIGTI